MRQSSDYRISVYVQVSGWEANKIAKLQRKNWVSVEMGVTEWAKDEFWTAPEVLSQRSIPTMAADVYSFAIVMQVSDKCVLPSVSDERCALWYLMRLLGVCHLSLKGL